MYNLYTEIIDTLYLAVAFHCVIGHSQCNVYVMLAHQNMVASML